MKKIIDFIKSNPKTILTLFGITISVYLMLLYQLDVRTIIIIGPLIIKIFAVPLLWLINGERYFTSAYAIK